MGAAHTAHGVSEYSIYDITVPIPPHDRRSMQTDLVFFAVAEFSALLLASNSLHAVAAACQLSLSNGYRAQLHDPLLS